MKKTIILISFLSLCQFSITAQCNLDLGDNTLFPFATGDLIKNTSIASDRTHTQSFDVGDLNLGTCASLDGFDDLTIQMDIIETFDTYGGTIISGTLNAGTTHDVQQNTGSGAKGLKGSIPLSPSGAKRTTPGDVRGYKIKVEFDGSVIVKAEQLTVNYSSGNTKGKAFETMLISFFDETGAYFSSQPSYQGLYTAGPVETALCNTYPTKNEFPWGTPGTGFFAAQDTTTVNTSNTCTTTGTGGSSGGDDTGSIDATATGISASTRVGGFEFMIYLEDVASAIDEATATTTSTTFSSVLMGMNISSPSLPVELLDFSADQKEEAVQLNWSTATEENNDYFTIETSTDGLNFTVVETIQGAGTSLDTREYSYIHHDPTPGANYYRLKQTDFDGQFSYSDTKVVYLDYQESLKVFPTLVQNEINIAFANEGMQKLPVSIFDLTGAKVKSLFLDSPQMQNRIDLSGLEKGYYLLSTTINGERVSYKFVKM